MRKFLALLLSFAVAFGMTPLSFAFESYAEDTSAEDEIYYGEPGEDYEEGEVIVCVKGGTQALVASGIFSKEATKLASGNKQIKAEKFDGLETTIAKQEITIDETLIEFETSEGKAEQAAAVSHNDEEAYAEAVQTQEEETKADEEPYSFILIKSKKDDVTNLIEKLEKLDCVAFAEPNIKCEPTSASLTLADAEDEPGYKYQWYLDKSGIGAEFDVAATEAYQKTGFANEKEVVVAVMDTGVDYTHPDLQDSMWTGGTITALTNLGGGKYGINTSGEGNKNDPQDRYVGHGTHCASTIASNWKNQKGVAGVNGNAKIMACGWMGATGGDPSDWIVAMNYVLKAKEKGVNVVATNNSWGPSGNLGYVGGSVDLMCNLAGEQGIVSCFAAGNDKWNHDKFPNLAYSSPYIVTVGAMQSNGEAASFSERGEKTVDVFAPGTQILAATTLQNGGDVDMAPQYLPWVQPSTDSVVYEDFEDDNYEISASGHRYVGGSGKPDPDIIKRNVGLGDSKSIGLDLSNYENANEIGIEIEVPKTAIDQIDDKCYMAFETGIKDFSFKSASTPFYGNEDVAIMEYWNGSEWKVLTYTTSSGSTQPTLAVGYRDKNCSILSGELTAPNISDIKSAASAVGELKLRIAIKLENKTSTSEFYIDNFGIGTKASDYYYSNGTSMATPCTAAVVSMIAGARNTIPSTSADSREVIARLKGGVKKTGKLDNDCVTQGCVQATSAFMTEDELNPVPTGLVTYTNGTAKIGGYFFGDSSGDVKIGGLSANILSWSNKELMIEIPAAVKYGVQEISITKSNGNTGRWFNAIKLNKTESDKGYIDLNTYKKTYRLQKIDGSYKDYKTQDMIPVRIAANDDGILAILTDVEDSFGRLLFYSFDTGTWKDVSISSDADFRMSFSVNSSTGNPDHCYALAGEGHKIYLACNNSRDGLYWLCTLDTSNASSPTWTKKVEIPWQLRYGPIGIIDGKLYVTLGMGYDGTVCELNPNNGDMTPSPYATISYDTEYVDFYFHEPQGMGGYFLTSGSNKVIAGYKIFGTGYDDKMNKSFKPLAYKDGAWVKSQKDIYASMDANQLYWAAYGATNQGFIMAGPAKDIGKETMNDTWAYDISSDSYRALGVSLDNSRMRAQAGTCHGNKFYVMGSSGNDNKLMFKYLDLTEFGLSQYDHTHTLVGHASNDATREATGNSAYWSCETCDKYFRDKDGVNECSADSWIIPRIRLHMTHYEAITETCTADGRSEYWHCSEDGKFYSDNRGLHEISENSWVIPKHHTLTAHASSQATCTASGNSAYWSCNGCNKYFSDASGVAEIAENTWVTPISSHSMKVVNPPKPATCTERGVKEFYECEYCEKYYWDLSGNSIITNLYDVWIEKIPHSLNHVSANAATCAAVGNTEHWECSACGGCFNDASASGTSYPASHFALPALGHSKTTHQAQEATCTASGNSAYTACSRCHKYFSDSNCTNEISANSWITSGLGHITPLEHVSGQAATASNYGWHEHWMCTRQGCGMRFKTATGDAYTDDSWKIPATGGGSNPPGGGGGGNESSGTEEKIVMPDVSKLKTSDVTYAVSKDDLVFEMKGLENLKEGTDYEIHLLGLNPNSIGKHSGELVFLNAYTQLGTVDIEYVVVPQGTFIKKLSPKKKSMTVSFAKQKIQTTGYQIRYGLKSSMKSAKTITINKNTKTTATIKNLKSKKKYYVQTRTYKNVKETVKVKGKNKKKTVKYCSSWSEKKSVKVK